MLRGDIKLLSCILNHVLLNVRFLIFYELVYRDINDYRINHSRIVENLATMYCRGIFLLDPRPVVPSLIIPFPFLFFGGLEQMFWISQLIGLSCKISNGFLSLWGQLDLAVLIRSPITLNTFINLSSSSLTNSCYLHFLFQFDCICGHFWIVFQRMINAWFSFDTVIIVDMNKSYINYVI